MFQIKDLQINKHGDEYLIKFIILLKNVESIDTIETIETSGIGSYEFAYSKLMHMSTMEELSLSVREDKGDEKSKESGKELTFIYEEYITINRITDVCIEEIKDRLLKPINNMQEMDYILKVIECLDKFWN